MANHHHTAGIHPGNTTQATCFQGIHYRFEILRPQGQFLRPWRRCLARQNLLLLGLIAAGMARQDHGVALARQEGSPSLKAGRPIPKTMGHKHQAAIAPLAGLQDLQLDGLGAMRHSQANDALQHSGPGHNGSSRGVGWRCGREQLFGPLALLGHAADDLASPAQIEDHPFAGDGLDQAQQGWFAVLGRLDQGVPQGFAAEIRASAFERAQAGEHEHGLLEQGGSHRTIGHLGEAQRHWLVEQG